MRHILKVIQTLSLPYIVFTLMSLGCAPDPLTRGSVTLRKNTTPLGYTLTGKPLLIGDFSGNPFILYVKSRWCPLCKMLDSTLEESILKDGGKSGVNILTLELIDRKILDESGETVISPAEKGGGDFIPDLPPGLANSPHYVGNSGRVRKVLKLRRIPALIGFTGNGQVAGILYGYQSDMAEKIENLLQLVKSEVFEVKGTNGF